MMATNPALMTRTTLVAEEPWRTLLRRTLQAVAGALDRLLPTAPARAPPGVVQISSNLSERMFLAALGRPRSFENAPRKQLE
jgi:hypothetical protein